MLMAQKWYTEDTDTLIDWFRREQTTNGLNIEISSGGTTLCTCRGWREPYTITIPAPDGDERSKILLALRMAGLLDLNLSITNGTKPFSNEEKKTDDENFNSWFLSMSKDRTLVPDTNSVIFRTFSSLSSISGIDIKKIQIAIPRLLILELERQANDASKSDKKDEKKLLIKRKVMLAYAELIYLKTNGGTMLNDTIDKDTLAGFTKIAGDLTTDSWIRKEIKDEDYRLQQKGVDKKHTLVTSDLINSLSCTAEDIHSIYVSKIDSQNIRRANLYQTAKFLIIASVLLEKMDTVIFGKKHVMQGIWSGKTTSEWINDIIMCSFED